MSALAVRQQWEAYLEERTGTYEFRCRRYSEVFRELRRLGLRNGDLVYDVGAGYCEFGRHLFREAEWWGRYVPVDGAIDGTNLETWVPPITAHAFVAIEVVEHLLNPDRLLAEFAKHAELGAVVTTPNPATVDVLGMDRTHRSILPRWKFRELGWTTRTVSLFGKPEDTIVAVWSPERGWRSRRAARAA